LSDNLIVKRTKKLNRNQK